MGDGTKARVSTWVHFYTPRYKSSTLIFVGDILVALMVQSSHAMTSIYYSSQAGLCGVCGVFRYWCYIVRKCFNVGLQVGGSRIPTVFFSADLNSHKAFSVTATVKT